MDFLKSAVASAISKGPPFPYTFGDRLDLDQSIWTLYNGTKREDGSECSILSFDVAANRSRLVLARNAVRKLKTLRHPGVVRVLDTVETDTYIYVATERIIPLHWHLRRKSMSVETIKWGLYTVASTLKFINEEGVSVHGCVRASSIFTSQSGEWRLGGLDVLSSLKEDDAVIYNYAGLVPDINRYAPPEVAKTDWTTVRKSPVSATDSYAFGLLVYEVFNNGELGMNTSAAPTQNIPPSMQQPYKRLLNANPKPRLTVGAFLEQGRRSGGFFETPLIRLSEGVESMGLKSDIEREALLGELDEVADDFPEDFFKMKILPELTKSVEFGGGGPKVLGYIMKIGAKLPDDEFESRLNPFLLRLFASPDRQLRVSLLDNLPLMIEHFTQKVVTDKIWPQIVMGFSDTVPIVREQTVKSVLTLVNKLSDRVINGELLKCLAKTANDEQPGIRTNTTICLGKIARNLGTNTRTKVLIAAFTRSLRDSFVHARNAALQALAATSELFSEEDCAAKLLPSICPSLVDREKIVRDQAVKTVDLLLSRIRKHVSTMPDTALPPANTTVNGAPRMETPTPDTSAAGWAGWAISSFTNKLAAASGEIHDTASKSNGTSSLSPTIEPARSTSAASVLVAPSQARPTQLSRTISTPAIIKQDTSIADAIDFDAAWGDLEEEEEADNDEDNTFFDAPATPKPAESPTPFDDGGEPDFAGWLKAQSQGKSKTQSLPKGLKAAPKGIGTSTATSKLAPTTKTPLTAKTPTSPFPSKNVNRKGIPARPAAGQGTTSSTSSTSASMAQSAAQSAAAAAAEKKLDTKPKDDGDEGDGWGAWD